ncbi:MAG: bifunctional hydroxymethylpyrimidine kinase/phosphomethylpyrimidine kinase, partial [Firmicutes bacterium]|nr:bifunctional hydroxymethylpyrimidine kinase/phosphomethylpyrimidine kinase [Bacillota bacterium]
VCDANPSPEALERFAALADGIPLFADPVSAAKATRLLPILPRLTLIKPNVMELVRLTDLPCNSPETIAAAADSLLEKGTGAVCVSLGRDGCYYADRNGERFTLAIPPVEVMGNATGAGDAFLAAMIHATLKGLPPRDAVRFALGAGRLAVRSPETINPEMSESMIEKELNE